MSDLPARAIVIVVQRRAPIYVALFGSIEIAADYRRRALARTRRSARYLELSPVLPLVDQDLEAEAMPA